MSFSSEVTEILGTPCMDRHDRGTSRKSSKVWRPAIRDALLETGFGESGDHLCEQSQSIVSVLSIHCDHW